MKKIVLRGAGCLAVGLGVAGAFLPLLPTTPFLLLAAWCFARSSPRLHAWLLENPLCGRYIRNYQQGMGIPPQVKTATILMLWGGMAFSAILFVDPWWSQGLMYLIAAGVSLHILRIRPRQTPDPVTDICLFVPTEAEIAPFRALQLDEVSITVTGIGTTATFTALEKTLRARKPRLAILAGIAGTYDDSAPAIGESVLVAEEREADLGSFSEGEFELKFGRRYRCPSLPETVWHTVVSNSVNAAAGPYVPRAGAQIENMEGAAFFAYCLDHGIPFLEVRTISNRVGDPFAAWDFPLAAENLATTLTTLIHETLA